MWYVNNMSLEKANEVLKKFYINYVICELSSIWITIISYCKFYINYVICESTKIPLVLLDENGGFI